MLLWGGEAVSELGSQVSTVAFPLLILTLTGSPSKAGVVGLAKWLPLAVCAVPAGMLADRVDRRRLMIASDAVRAGALGSVAVMLWLGGLSYLQVVVVAFLDGALFVTSYIAERGALRQVVAVEQLPDAVAQNQARSFGALIAGPPLGGLLFALGRALPFIVDTISFIASIAGLSLIRTSFQEPRAMRRGGWRESFVGFGWLWCRPFFRTTLLLFAAGNPLYTGLYLLAILLAKHSGASSAEVGMMFAIIGGGGLLGAVLARPLWRRASARSLLVANDWLIVAVVPVLAVAHNAVLIGLIVAAAELLTPAGNAVVTGARVATTADHLQGRVAAASTTLAMSLGWLGPLAVGLAFEHAGPTATVLLIVGWALALALAVTSAPALRTPPSVPAGAGASAQTLS